MVRCLEKIWHISQSLHTCVAIQASGSNYNKRLAQSFHLRPKDPKDLLCRIAVQDDEYEEILTEEMVSEFQTILGTYIDFLQKDKFNKLKKLRQSQANLPIAEYRQEILDSLEKNQVIIIAGDTGCGKSTQVPQYLLQANYAKIACTQPRRIACISLAKRVGYETLNEYGTEVSFFLELWRFWSGSHESYADYKGYADFGRFESYVGSET